MNHETVLIIDFGGQYSQLIARRVRDHKVYCEILPYTVTEETIKEKNPKGIIFSGGPNSVYEENSPKIFENIFKMGIPILGICYGAQLMTQMLGGTVTKGDTSNREYGRAEMKIEKSEFYDGVTSSEVWMSHTDYISKMAEGFKVIGSTQECPVAAYENIEKKLIGLQYHPEVEHSIDGHKMIYNFLYKTCNLKGDWTSDSYIEEQIKKIKDTIGDKKAICALSGGVDSSVAATLAHKAIGQNLICIFVDHGLMRKNEGDEVEAIFKDKFNMNFIRVNAEDRFLSKLKGISDPETKRKIIGEEFIRVFEEESNKFSDAEYLIQGTIYPDIVESGVGSAATIKSHHNVGGLPEDVKFKGIVEPLRELFKDEVRRIGLDLGVDENLIKRHPFPGPGLAIRVIGEITKDKLDLLREADAIYIEELKKNNLYDKIWQAFAVLPNVKTVGVMGDSRTYDNLIGLRAVNSSDGMSSDWFPFPYDLLAHISNRIINEVSGVNRVVYDITSKPPGTIEWE